MTGLLISSHTVEGGAIQRASQLNSRWRRRSPPARIPPTTLPPPRTGRRHRPSTGRMLFIPSRIAHFWSKVDKGAECWTWTGARAAHGYGQFSANNVHIMAHRYAYIVARGSIPEGYQVTHKCDNILCMNPDHLLAVTSEERGKLQRARRAALRANQILRPAAIGALVTLLRAEGEQEGSV
jgi:hypothetical protein